MSWFSQLSSAAASAAGGGGDGGDGSPGSGGRRRADVDPEASDPEEPGTPSRGVKEDLSAITQTLARRFWGVASFLAPPPEEQPQGRAREAEEQQEEEEGEDQLLSPRIAGIRSDLAEIGGRVRSGISLLSSGKAVAEISKIASSILAFGPGEEEQEMVGGVGVTEEVLVFVRHIALQPETWLDFPLWDGDLHADDDFELSETQYEHAVAIERLVPSLGALRTELCPSQMSEESFWKIYFVLLYSKLNKQDAELLSTTQILEARAKLIRSSGLQAKPSYAMPGNPPSSTKCEAASSKLENPAADVPVVVVPLPRTEEREVKVAGPHEAPPAFTAPAGAADVETEKHADPATEVEVVDKIIDKAVIEQPPSTIKNSPSIVSAPKSGANVNDEEVDEWPEEEEEEAAVATKRAAAPRSAVTPVLDDEDVSFSDLEEDDDNT